LEISTAEIEYGERRFIVDVFQQRIDVLADIVIARALPEFFSMLVVMFQREIGDFFQVSWKQIPDLRSLD